MNKGHIETRKYMNQDPISPHYQEPTNSCNSTPDRHGRLHGKPRSCPYKEQSCQAILLTIFDFSKECFTENIIEQTQLVKRCLCMIYREVELIIYKTLICKVFEQAISKKLSRLVLTSYVHFTYWWRCRVKF